MYLATTTDQSPDLVCPALHGYLREGLTGAAPGGARESCCRPVVVGRCCRPLLSAVVVGQLWQVLDRIALAVARFLSLGCRKLGVDKA
jgi:hypothetical protein